MRWGIVACILVGLGSCAEQVFFIPGTGTLPDCDEAPITSLDGSSWYDGGTVTILTAGCEDAMPDDTFIACALDWVFEQDGNDVSILVDTEYRIQGRLCGDQLYLRGGWWLPVEDAGFCTYEEDSAEEVGVEQEGNVLTVSSAGMSGTLLVQGACRAEYEVIFERKSR
jgi:hypothetical protein